MSFHYDDIKDLKNEIMDAKKTQAKTFEEMESMIGIAKKRKIPIHFRGRFHNLKNPSSLEIPIDFIETRNPARLDQWNDKEAKSENFILRTCEDDKDGKPVIKTYKIKFKEQNVYPKIKATIVVGLDAQISEFF